MNKKSLILTTPKYKLKLYEIKLLQKEILIKLGKKIELNPKELLKIPYSQYLLDRAREITFLSKIEFSFNSRKIKTFQFLLEDLKFESKKKNSKYITHGIHSYKGKFYPQLAKSLLNISGIKKDSVVFDPFCGSGTSLLESYLNGFKGYGIDVNPVAAMISKAKIEIIHVNVKELRKTVNKFLKKIDNTKVNNRLLNFFPKENHQEILNWFPKNVACKLSLIIQEISKLSSKKIQNFLKVILSNIIREVSQQDPKDLRIRKRKNLLKDVNVFKIFKENLKNEVKKLDLFHYAKNHFLYDFHKSKVALGDSRFIKDINKIGIKHRHVDLVLTSPPYATALPYVDTDRLSLLILFGIKNNQTNLIENNLIGSRDIKLKERKIYEAIIKKNLPKLINSKFALNTIKKIFKLNNSNNVGFRKKNMSSILIRYFMNMEKVMKNLDKIIKINGKLIFVIGDNFTTAGNEKIKIQNSKILEEIGQSLNWKLIEKIPITVTKENTINIKNSISNNDILIFKKLNKRKFK